MCFLFCNMYLETFCLYLYIVSMFISFLYYLISYRLFLFKEDKDNNESDGCVDACIDDDSQ